MVYFNLNLTSNELILEYTFTQEFLDKKYEIALIKLDGNLEINKKININYTNNKLYYLVNGVDKNNNPVNEASVIDIPNGKHISENKFNSKTIDNNLLERTIAEGSIFVWCNLIDDSYVNNKKINSIYRFRFDDDEINEQSLLISIEPRQVIYHKVASRPNKIILKLIDINNNLIEFNNVNLFVELHMKEIS
jgi:hypothetical protein